MKITEMFTFSLVLLSVRVIMGFSFFFFLFLLLFRLPAHSPLGPPIFKAHRSLGLAVPLSIVLGMSIGGPKFTTLTAREGLVWPLPYVLANLFPRSLLFLHVALIPEC